MNRKKKYRRFVLWCLALDLLFIGWMGYCYLDRKVPDEIYVSKNRNQNVGSILEFPFLTFDKAVPVSGNGSYLLSCKLMGILPFKQIKVTPRESKDVMVSGSTVGMYMETEGVLIIDTGEIVTEQGEPREPAKNIVKPGDYIVAFNDEKISRKKDLLEDLKKLEGEEVVLDVMRNGEMVPVSIKPVKDRQGAYKLGIWVRDDTQGIGTLTFVDDRGRYGALGHGISDMDTGELLQIQKGTLYQAQILSIQKGSKGSPGELSGLIRYEPGKVIGTIVKNSKNGIYGQFMGGQQNGIFFQPMKMGFKQEVTEGKASILCCVEEEVKEYAAEITKIDMNHEDTNKSFVIHITDPRLLSVTGGIVQGMSGSPIIQDGKLVGAVTHVLVNDPTKGYGIFIENMLDAAA